MPDSQNQGMAQQGAPQQGTPNLSTHPESIESQKHVDRMSLAQRWGGLYTVFLMILLLLFFAVHQWKKTLFFNAKFGPLEMVALYLPIIVSLIPPVQRLIQGKRNPSRPIDAISDMLLATGAIILWNNFPFDFAHIADIFPPSMRLALAWFNNNIARFILLLQIVIGYISALAIIATYITERRKITDKEAN